VRDAQSVMLSSRLLRGVVVTALALVLVRPWGGEPEFAYDSHKYITAADNLLAGKGLSQGCGTWLIPLTHWAPVYSVVLAAAQTTGLDRFRSPLWINAVAVAAALWLVAALVARSGGGRAASWMAAIALGAHFASARWSGVVLSEPVSWLLLVAALICGLRLSVCWDTSNALMLGLICSLGLLTRYAFVGLAGGLLGGGLLLGVLEGRTREALRAVAVAGCCSAVPLIVWLSRNIVLTGRPVQGESWGGGVPAVLANGKQAIRALAACLFGSSDTRTLVPLIAVGCAGACWIWGAWRAAQRIASREPSRLADRALLLAFSMGMAYFLYILAVRSVLAPVSLDTRMFSPMSWLGLISLFVWIASRQSTSESGARHGIGMATLAVVGVSVSTLAALPSVQQTDRRYWRQRGNGVVSLALSSYPENRLLSSDPEVFWLSHGACVGKIPVRQAGKFVAFSGETQSGPTALVWLRHSARGNLVEPRALEKNRVVRSIEVDDGIIVELSPGIGDNDRALRLDHLPE